MIHIDYTAMKDCKNSDTYGEICVKCNKCHRFNEIKEINNELETNYKSRGKVKK